MTATVICQIDGPFDEQRGTRLPAQCCGEPADQIWKCEQVAPSGHKHQVGEHTILRERMGNGYSCTRVEQQLHLHGGLRGFLDARAPAYVRLGR